MTPSSRFRGENVAPRHPACRLRSPSVHVVSLDVHIKRLRAKVEPTPDTPECIVTIRGLGYKLST
ncbi:MAG: hypothetical protein CL433_04275 [Acidimicrobiaceae bacterium]|nr:hypothetical protein [Acidimicrobiaceae bacterium]HAB57160.1 hypothetical protein [Acidimicrobiaceae bacterium]